jgi:hypothetical protein
MEHMFHEITLRYLNIALNSCDKPGAQSPLKKPLGHDRKRISSFRNLSSMDEHWRMEQLPSRNQLKPPELQHTRKLRATFFSSTTVDLFIQFFFLLNISSVQHVVAEAPLYHELDTCTLNLSSFHRQITRKRDFSANYSSFWIL